MVWKNDYWRYITVFLFALAISISWLDWKSPMVVNVDTPSYLEVAKQINNRQWPDFSARGPIYPLFLSFFSFNKDSFKLIVWENMLTNSIGAVFYLWFLDNLFGKKWLNVFIINFLFMDYGIISFQNILLSESICLPITIFSIFVNLLLIKKGRKGLIKKEKLLIFILILIGDSLLMFLKSALVLLPLIIKIYLFLYTRYFERETLVRIKKILLASVFVNVILMIGLLTYNFLNKGTWRLSSIGSVNTLDRELKLRFLKKNEIYKNVPKNVETIMNFSDFNSAWDIHGYLLEKKIVSSEAQVYEWFDQTNKYFLSYPRNLWKYIISGFYSLPDITIERRSFLLQPSAGVSKNLVFIGVDNFFNKINGFKLLGIMATLGVYFVLLRKKARNAVYLGVALITVIYTLIVVALFSSGDFYRLRLPVEMFLNLFIFLPVFYWWEKTSTRIDCGRRRFK